MNSNVMILKVQNYIEEHLEEDILLSDLCKIAGYSEYYFIRVFKKNLGVNPIEYVCKRRLAKASEDILAGLLCDANVKGNMSENAGIGEIPTEVSLILNKLFENDLGDGDVILIRLAERLHNMRTIEFIDESKKRAKAEETVKKYMPYAEQLGNKKIIAELKQLSSRYLQSNS